MGHKFVLHASKSLISFLIAFSKNAYAHKDSSSLMWLIYCQNVFQIVEMESYFYCSKNVMTKTISVEMDAILLAKFNLDSYAQLNSQANVLYMWILKRLLSIMFLEYWVKIQEFFLLR